jgi:hypothetical protein
MSTQFKQYYSSTVHRAGRFSVGMAEADASVLCLDINRGHDSAQSDVCIYNGNAIFIRKINGQILTAEPGNWIVRMPDESLDVHADEDFCKNFCPATAS